MMADRHMRGSRLGAVSYETDRNYGLAPRQIARYRTENGEEFEVPFADDAEIPGTWLCRNGMEGILITSFPGLADSTGARVLAEIGDDRVRFADARALKAYAGSAPVTRASGRSLSVTHRHIKNNRLANVGWMWAFTAASNCEPARQHYRQRREHGDRHAAANRNLLNKLLGQLYYCRLQHHQRFDEAKAFPMPLCDAA